MLENNDVPHIIICCDCDLNGNVFNTPVLFALGARNRAWIAMWQVVLIYTRGRERDTLQRLDNANARRLPTVNR